MSDDINVNEIADALNNKVDLADGANQGNVGYVVASKFPTASDQTWYRLYSDGWVEQGGNISATSNSKNNEQILLQIEMYDTNYTVTLGTQRNGTLSDGYAYYLGSVGTKTTTSFGIYLDSTGYVSGCYWEVKGMGA